MRCPYCNSQSNKVTDSRDRDGGDAVWRRRLCLDCDRKFSTYERIEESSLIVVKNDGKKELFCREKALGGLIRASKKRPVDMDVLKNIILSLEYFYRTKESSEVSTREIGEYLMNALKEVDLVAYLRFASVYKDFAHVADFINEVNMIIHNQKED